MKKALAIAGGLALTITPTVSFADHLEPKESEIRPGGNLAHTNLFRASLSGADLSDANLSFINLRSADLSGANLRDNTASNISGCPISLPSGWVCKTTL